MTNAFLFLAWGNPGSPIPILGFHGFQDNAGTFDRLVPYLSNSLYFVAVDLPGHGMSSHMPLGLPYHFGDFIIAMRRIANYFKWTKFSIIGHSMGAGLGVYFASMYPNIVDKLVMLDMIKPISSDEGPTGLGMGSAIDMFLSLEDKVKPELSPSYSYQDALDRLRAATENRYELKKIQGYFFQIKKNQILYIRLSCLIKTRMGHLLTLIDIQDFE